jgi:hypothetical protein
MISEIGWLQLTIKYMPVTYLQCISEIMNSIKLEKDLALFYRFISQSDIKQPLEFVLFMQ